jgi:hypothetical protein
MRPVICILLLMLTGALSFGQRTKVRQNTREVVINSGDSIIVTNIMLNQEKIRPDIRFTYYWYLRGKISHNTGGFSGKLLDGKYQVFVQDRLVLSGTYNEGKRSGEWVSWNNDGSIKNSCAYFDGAVKTAKAEKHSRHFLRNPFKKEKKKTHHTGIFHKKEDKTANTQDKP